MTLARFTEFMAEHVLRVNRALHDVGVPYAFGGAIANAFCGEPRGTTAIDFNILLPETDHGATLDALERIGVAVRRPHHASLIQRDGQVRLPWDGILVDLFFMTFDFLETAGGRTRLVPFGADHIPVLSAEDLIICKVAFNREKDWFDLRNIIRIQGNRLDTGYITYWLTMFGEDQRVERAQKLLSQYAG